MINFKSSHRTIGQPRCGVTMIAISPRISEMMPVYSPPSRSQMTVSKASNGRGLSTCRAYHDVNLVSNCLRQFDPTPHEGNQTSVSERHSMPASERRILLWYSYGGGAFRKLLRGLTLAAVGTLIQFECPMASFRAKKRHSVPCSVSGTGRRRVTNPRPLQADARFPEHFCTMSA